MKYFTIAPALRGSAAIAGTMKPVNQGVMRMTKYIIAGALTLMSTAALAGQAWDEVPEMSAGAGVAAVALLIGVAAIIRERSKRK